LPSAEELSKLLNVSEKVINNVYDINGGENFNFVSFQSLMNANNNKNGEEGKLENKLMNEYLEASSTSQMDNYELQDLLSELKKQVKESDYNMFLDKYLHNLSYSDIAKKYNLKFPSSSKYIIERVERICKKLIS
jgi:Glu-tRNA(Gln) amidotransferase subunit E-like FAD-binding protein